MVDRLLSPSESSSYFLFGARGVGKTTFLKSRYPQNNCLYIDLLDPDEEELFHRSPAELTNRIAALKDDELWIIIDEIQKAPKLLDLVHKTIETKNRKFILTGSSSRKLKRGVSNLLAGRAFVYHMHPFTHCELGKAFDLDTALQWGALPKVYEFTANNDKQLFLKAYTRTYLKEEIVAEQIVRNLDPFRNFLEVAAQSNGKIINYSKIAHDVGVDTKTIQAYFTILEYTLIGFKLPAFHRSIRKQQNKNPKFYLFDTGIKRALDRTITLGMQEGTYAYGEAFEHFLILEIIRCSSYLDNDWKFSYLRTKDDAEIDLIIERPGLPIALIEIKSNKNISKRDISNVARFSLDISDSQGYCLSRDPHSKKINNILCLPWQKGLEELGLKCRL